ncbi:hypothetical protein ORJ04_06315 [Rheinheimera baltica]|uniref:Ankyrin repeat protein n=1 Tax=Rheinheimera baltica TaxID=67576 RepID=A0ABT9HWP8_9GAMM|nr:hypothetical protein [Rheinheimera baltica]MDP5135562.1 hypothetical protein [Rheinheimera baltica]
MSKKTLTQDEIKALLQHSDAARRILRVIQEQALNPDLLRYGERKLPLLNELLAQINDVICYDDDAAIKKNIAVCLMLLEAGVKPQQHQRDRYCPLSQACYGMRFNVLEIEPIIHALLQAGAKPALCKQPHLLYVCGLLSECKEGGYFTSPSQDYKKQVTDPAKKQALLNIIAALTQCGADINDFDKFNKYNPLMLAVQTEVSCIVPELLALGADVNITNHAGNTPLLFACGDVEVTSSRMTHYKQVHRSVKTIRQLLAAGADPSVGNNNGRTPLSVASKDGYHDICYELYLALNKRGMFYAEDRKYFKDSPYKDRIDAKASLPSAPPKQKRKAEGQAESWSVASKRLSRSYPDSRIGDLILQLTQSDALNDVRNSLFADTYNDAVHLGKTKKVSYSAGSITIVAQIYGELFRISFEREGLAEKPSFPLRVDIAYQADVALPVEQVQAVILQMLPGLA